MSLRELELHYRDHLAQEPMCVPHCVPGHLTYLSLLPDMELGRPVPLDLQGMIRLDHLKALDLSRISCITDLAFPWSALHFLPHLESLTLLYCLLPAEWKPLASLLELCLIYCKIAEGDYLDLTAPLMLEEVMLEKNTFKVLQPSPIGHLSISSGDFQAVNYLWQNLVGLQYFALQYKSESCQDSILLTKQFVANLLQFARTVPRHYIDCGCVEGFKKQSHGQQSNDEVIRPFHSHAQQTGCWPCWTSQQGVTGPDLWTTRKSKIHCSWW